jgi:histidinol-phosphate aminotransferase
MNSQDAANTQQPDVRRVSRREFGWSTVAATLGAGLAAHGTLSAQTSQTAASSQLVRSAAAAITGKPIRIGSNENPYGLGPSALAAVQAGCPEANRYPGASIGELTARLAEVHSISRDRILLSPGSGEILRAATRAFTSPTKTLVGASPTFEAPGRAARMSGATAIDVPVTAGGSMDLPAMAAKAAGAGMFFICNPNNPTGGVNSSASIDEFVAAVRRVSPDALLLIDEAYFEYVEDPSYATAIPLTAKDPRIIVSRTFSKIHGMAGLRVGYAIGHPDALGAMRGHMSQGSISGLSASTALASLNDTAHMAKQVAMNKDARAYTVKAFTDAGFKVLPTQANFVMVDVKRDASSFQGLCREQGVMIARSFPPLTTHARVSIGTMDEMKRAMAVMLPLLATAPASARVELPRHGEAPESIAPGVMVDESDLFTC